MGIEFELEKLLNRIGSEVVNIAKGISPYVTGNLRKDIQIISVNSKSVTIGNTTVAKYAKFVHNGTKPYKIRAKKRAALKTPYGAFKAVNHPGIKANPYLKNALDRYISSGGMDRALNSFSKKVLDDSFKNTKWEIK